MIDEMKRRATPRINKLLNEAYENDKKLDISNALADIQIMLLARLCELKEDQKKGEDTRHEDWIDEKQTAAKYKSKDSKISLWVLVLANIALYLDVIKVDSGGRFITGLINLFS